MKYLYVAILTFLFVACETTPDLDVQCDVEINETTPENLLNKNVSNISIIDAVQEGDFLLLTLNIGGCAENQDVKLDYFNAFEVSDPSSIDAVLYVEQEQVCNANFRIERCVDISELTRLTDFEFLISFSNSNFNVVINN